MNRKTLRQDFQNKLELLAVAIDALRGATKLDERIRLAYVEELEVLVKEYKRFLEREPFMLDGQLPKAVPQQLSQMIYATLLDN
jgi:hypothetical protein